MVVNAQVVDLEGRAVSVSHIRPLDCTDGDGRASLTGHHRGTQLRMEQLMLLGVSFAQVQVCRQRHFPCVFPKTSTLNPSHQTLNKEAEHRSSVKHRACLPKRFGVLISEVPPRWPGCSWRV